MSVYLRLGGAAIITLAAVFVGREYSAFADRRLSELRGFLSLITHIEKEISKFQSCGDGLWRGFFDDPLTDCGFLPSLAETGSPSEAFSRCEDRLSLSGEQRELLFGFFADFGSDYREGELRRLAEFRTKLNAILEAETENLKKSVKVTKTLLLGGGLAAAIMVI